MRTPRPWLLPTLPATRAILVGAGITDEMIEAQLASGRLRRLRHGIYVQSASWPEKPGEQHLMLARAEQTVTPRGVLSHNSAALVWGLPTPGLREWYDDPPTLTYPAGSTDRARAGAARRRTANLPGTDVTLDDLGFPVTSLARTAVDLADRLPLPDALVILDAAGRILISALLGRPRPADFANPRLVHTVRESLAAVSRPRAVSRLLSTIEKVEPCRESPAESLTAGHLYLSGLPMPIFQAEIPSPFGTLRPDCYWPDRRLIGECDGAVKYADQASILKEKRREQWFRDEDYAMVRWLGAEILHQPADVMDRIGRALS